MLVENPTIGSDVEYFVKNKITGDIITAEGLIKGTKYDPYRFVKDNPFFAMQLDNVLAEGNIPPAKDEKEFIEYLSFLRESINQELGSDKETVAEASFTLKKEYLESEIAKQFGCDPSYDAWNDQILHPSVSKNFPLLRSAGFHIHIGYDNLSADTNIALVRAMDLYLGVPATLIEPENQRKAVGYGVAGNYRNQPHGVEYRTLSSYFASSDELISWVFKSTHKAIELVNAYPDKDFLYSKHLFTIKVAINTSNKEALRKFVKDYSLELPRTAH